MVVWLKRLSKSDRECEKVIALRNCARLYGWTLSQQWLDLAKEISKV